MAAVTEMLVREYFEALGFLVIQPCKHTVPGRPRAADEVIDLLVVNPRIKTHQVPGELVWTGRSLQHVARAIVGICGWHTDRFYASTFEQTPEILRFAEADAIESAAKAFGTPIMAKVLCLPRLPASEDLREKSIDVLRAKGIDGVIPFRTILAELAAHIDTNRNYEKSDALQIIRLLKNYDLLKDAQLELFAGKRRRRKPPKAE